MTFEEYVLTAKDSEGKIIITVAEYYERYIKPLDNRFASSSYYGHSKVLCCWKDHTDINPSLGTMPDKFFKGVKLYNCMGCGAHGNVIRMHQRIQHEYHNRDITDNESRLELCKLFGVDAKAFEEMVDIGDQARFMERFRKTCDIKNMYTLRDYSSDLLSVRANSSLSLAERAHGVNIANIKYISTTKQLYD